MSSTAVVDAGFDSGIQQPPSEMKDAIDKVASFVAKSPEAEGRLLKEQANNPKLAFLHPTSPYYAYYSQKVRQEKVLLSQAPSTTTESKEEEQKAHEEAKPPPPFEWVLHTDPATIPSALFDIIRLTAQFVAINGRSFQMGLVNRESKNPSFGFLQSNHPLHELFQQLVECYTRISTADEISNNIVSPQSKVNTSKQKIINRILVRSAWKKAQVKSEEQQRQENEAERTAVASIDWNDAVVVETISFDSIEDEFLPAPIDPSKALAVYLETKTKEEQQRLRREEEEKEMVNRQILQINPQQSSFSADASIAITTAISSSISKTQLEPQTVVDMRKGARRAMAICPICRQPIPIDEMSQHMKYEISRKGQVSVVDPSRSVEQQDRDAVVATGEDIAAHLMKMAKKRKDLFGEEEGEDEISSAIKVDNIGSANLNVNNPTYQRFNQVIANFTETGVSSSYIPPSTVPSSVMTASTSTTHPYDAFKLTGAPAASPHATTVPTMLGTPMAPMVPPILPPPTHSEFSVKRPGPEEMEDVPMAKKSKPVEVIDLIPEKEWIAQHPEDVTLKIVVESEGDANITFDVTLSPSTSVKGLKDALVDKCEIPTNKQVIKVDVLGFLKDKLTLAHYNIAPGTTVYVSPKERGGRKK